MLAPIYVVQCRVIVVIPPFCRVYLFTAIITITIVMLRLIFHTTLSYLLCIAYGSVIALLMISQIEDQVLCILIVSHLSFLTIIILRGSYNTRYSYGMLQTIFSMSLRLSLPHHPIRHSWCLECCNFPGTVPLKVNPKSNVPRG